MFNIQIRKPVVNLLESLDEKTRKRCKESIDQLQENPYLNRPKCDIKKLSGKHGIYRLRVGKYRFTYIITNKIIIVQEAFLRERGY